jgi:TonB family protein
VSTGRTDDFDLIRESGEPVSNGSDVSRGSRQSIGEDWSLLREWREPVPKGRLAAAGAGSLLFHLFVLLGLSAIPGPPPIEETTLAENLRQSVPLYVPKELTQRDPNAGKITHDLDVRSAAPPAPIPQAPRFRLPAVRPGLTAPQIDAPQIDAAALPPPAPSAGNLPQVAPPPAEKPKLAFEPVGAGGTSHVPNVNVKIPKAASVADEAWRAPAPPAASQGSSGGLTVGDIDEMNSLPFPNQAPSAGPVRSNLQLLSDPGGVDFKPYLIQVLTAVRANWLAVIPESARMGRRGRVLVQFIIDRRGEVPKLVIAESSGTAAFDRAAVAGISASYPFPPLPKGFKGNEIRLQLAFSYNMSPR